MVKSGKNRSGKKKSDSPHAGNVVLKGFGKRSEDATGANAEPFQEKSLVPHLGIVPG